MVTGSPLHLGRWASVTPDDFTALGESGYGGPQITQQSLRVLPPLCSHTQTPGMQI